MKSRIVIDFEKIVKGDEEHFPLITHQLEDCTMIFNTIKEGKEYFELLMEIIDKINVKKDKLFKDGK